MAGSAGTEHSLGRSDVPPYGCTANHPHLSESTREIHLKVPGDLMGRKVPASKLVSMAKLPLDSFLSTPTAAKDSARFGFSNLLISLIYLRNDQKNVPDIRE